MVVPGWLNWRALHDLEGLNLFYILLLGAITWGLIEGIDFVYQRIKRKD
jgi:hypothetical protein